MAIAAKDGAWVHSQRVVRMDCSKCGHVLTTERPYNNRELEKLMKDHIQSIHGGLK